MRRSTPIVRSIPFFLMLLAICLLAGCGGGGGGGSTAVSTASSAQVSVLLTDAPSDEFSAVNVTVKEIILIGDNGQVPVFQSAAGKVVNLLDLAGEAVYLGTRDKVPAGCYSKVRLVISDIELLDKSSPPQALQTDLPANGKIDLNPRETICLSGGEKVALQLDMDAEKSLFVHQTGNGRYKVRPVVFIDVIRKDFSGKLVRLEGQVEEVSADSFLLCPPQAVPAASDDAQSVTQCVDVSTLFASIFDGNGDPADLSVLSPGDRVQAIGRFRLSEPVADDSISSRPQFDAEVVEDGHFLILPGAVATTPQDNGAETFFDFEVAPGEGVAGVLATEIFPETRIFSCTGEELTPGALTVGRLVSVDGVIDAASGVFKSALIVVRMTEAPLSIRGVVTGVDGATIAVEDELGKIQQVKVTPNTHVYFSNEQGADFLLVPGVVGDIRTGQEVSLFGHSDAGLFLVQDLFILQ